MTKEGSQFDRFLKIVGPTKKIVKKRVVSQFNKFIKNWTMWENKNYVIIQSSKFQSIRIGMMK